MASTSNTGIARLNEILMVPARHNWSRLALYAIGLMPAVVTFWLGVIDRLGPEPIKALEHTLGLWALRFLIASLCVTPLRDLFGIRLLAYRRTLGLLAFYYALLHLLAWLVLDQGFAWNAIVKDILKRPYITIGMAAFVILIPLAVTSNAAMIKRLGAAAWQRLHRLVYLAAVLAAVHFIMVVKAWPPEPLVYAAIVAMLLLYRAVAAWRRPPARARTRSTQAANA
jgi:methionine sulfoxide reductase heme-binding subunit